MARLIALGACLAVAFVIFFAAAQTPPPLAAAAPAADFSAGRAMVDIAAMAPTPHPIGSPANHAVRDYLIGRMTALGLSPRVQRDESHASRLFDGEGWISGGDVENVIGVLPGRDRSTPALALMAHYDSVPGSPGAADDITGVASILEIVRAIETGRPPARDVLVVITDGEEAGLLGAHAFFADDPIAAQVGFVLNLESRGGGGRATMFETGAANGQAIELFRQTARRPLANSLTAFVYKLLPNDTDYTVARQRGLPGLNFAFIGRQFDYHSPSSTVAALDQGSVQQIGDEALGPARALAFAKALPAAAGDAVYGNLVGDLMVAYPPWAGWIVLAAALGALGLAVARFRREEPWTWLGAAQGVSGGVLLLIGSALLLDLARTATGVASGWMVYRPLLARFPAYEVAMALTALASLLAAVAAAALVRRRDAAFAPFWIGFLASGLTVAAGLQMFAPTTAFVISWPVLAGAACCALTAGATGRPPIGWAISLAIMALALAWLGSLFHSLLQSLDRADACALVVWLAGMVILPLLSPAQGGRVRGLLLGVALLAIGLSVTLWINVASPWTPRHPRAVMPLYVLEAGTGQAWRATPLPLDPWTRSVLRADGGSIVRRDFPGFAKPLNAALARPVSESAPAVSVARSPDGRVVVSAPLAAGASLTLDIRADVPVAAPMLNGKPTGLLTRPGRWTHVLWQAAPEGVVFSFRPISPGTLDLRWAQALDHWPAGAKPLPVMPAELMAWDKAGATVIVGDRRFAWKN